MEIDTFQGHKKRRPEEKPETPGVKMVQAGVSATSGSWVQSCAPGAVNPAEVTNFLFPVPPIHRAQHNDARASSLRI